VLVANGPIFAIRRELFQELYPEVANDFQIPIDIADGGHGVVYAPEAEAVEHTTVFWREEFQRKIRIVLRGLAGFSVLRRRIRGFRLWQFASHKLLRWMVGPFLVIAFVSNAVLATTSGLYAGFFVLQVLFYLAALIGSFLRHVDNPKKIFYVPFYFTMVNAAALVGMVKFLGGQRQVVWEKAESTRLKPVEPLAREQVRPPGRKAAGAGSVTGPRLSHDGAAEKPSGQRAKVAKN
jgi:hypothetical protein